MKYKPGDLIRIKPDAWKIEDELYFDEQMKQYCGLEFRIRSENEDYYTLEGVADVIGGQAYYWMWVSKWFEDPSEIKINILEDDLMNILMGD